MLSHIINQLSLIDTYCQVHVNIEKNFAILPKSMHHPTKMANTLQELHKKIWFYCCHHLVPGSYVEAKVPNILTNGLGVCYQANPDIDLGNVNTELGSLDIEDFDAM